MSKSEFLEIGKIVNTHGIRGEIKVEPWCDDPFLFCDLSYIYIDGKKYDINKARLHKNSVILELDSVTDINHALKFKNRVITVERSMLGDLAEGVYYICDLIGISVFTETNECLGIIEDVIQTGSNDVYQIKGNSKKPILIPALKDVILKVDMENSIMLVRIPEGLLD